MSHTTSSSGVDDRKIYRVTKAEPAGRRPHRIGLALNGEYWREIHEDVLRDSGVGVGAALDEANLQALAAADDEMRARESALNLLSYRARSRREVSDWLRRKDFDDDVIERVLGWLDERGYLDDVDFARAFARSRVRSKPRGAARIRAELMQRGVEAETARTTVEEAFRAEGRTEAEVARAFAEKWLRTSRTRPDEPAWRRRQRLRAALGRKGFGGEAVAEAIRMDPCGSS